MSSCRRWIREVRAGGVLSDSTVTHIGSGQRNEPIVSRRMFDIQVQQHSSIEAQSKTAVENAMAFVVDLIYSNVFLPSYT